MKSPTFSRRAGRVKASAIREILKVTERPDILSFAGGLPAPEAFPVEELARALRGDLRVVVENDRSGEDDVPLPFFAGENRPGPNVLAGGDGGDGRVRRIEERN